ncbi:MAG: hypothetical protein ACLVJH_17465 [Faecalibacterium prausnitzii]
METTLTASGYAASLPVCGQTVSGNALRRLWGCGAPASPSGIRTAASASRRKATATAWA